MPRLGARRSFRTISIFLCVFVLCCLLPAAASADANAGSFQSGGDAIGENGISMRVPTSQQQAAAQKIASTGAKWARIEADWWYIEGDQGRYIWDKVLGTNTPGGTDGAVAAARAAGLSVILLIQKTPPWARTTSNGSTPPTDPAKFGQFAAKVVQRYQPQGVINYEIWNEPNISTFWADPVTGGPKATAYVALLKAAYTAMKTVNPSIYIFSAGLAPFGQYNSATSLRVNPLKFLEQMYAAGAKNYLDGVGWHPYAGSQMPNVADASNGWAQMGVDFPAANQPSARTIMTRNGDSSKKIIMTEAGGSTGGNQAFFATEQLQAAAYRQAISLRDSYSWAGPLIFYTIDDFAPPGASADSEAYFGVYRSDGSAKPAFAVMQSARAALRSDQPITAGEGGQLKNAVTGARLILQNDGNLVLYSSNNSPLWASITCCNPGAKVWMQGDGNLVVYSASGTPLWASNSAGHPGSTLYLSDTTGQQLVIRDASGTITWNAGV